MLKTVRGFRGAVTSPHHAASHAGLNVLREGGNALEAAIATAAAIAVVYPHMNGLGGDNFWLIKPAGHLPIGIDACGAAAKGVMPRLIERRVTRRFPREEAKRL